MSTVFVLQNQFKHLLSKQKAWTSGRDARTLYSTPHKDEALNLMFELGSKDYTQRITLLNCELNDKRVPIVAPEDLPELRDFETPLEIDAETPIESTGSESIHSEPSRPETTETAGSESTPPIL